MSELHLRQEAGLVTPSGGTIGPVSYVIVHHTASQGAPEGWVPQRWKALELGEIARGYSSLAYQFGVTKGTGATQEARGWGNRGAATGGTAPNGLPWNVTSVAVVVDGYFHPDVHDSFTETAVNAVADVIVMGVFLGRITNDFQVLGHRTASAGTSWATACPGADLQPRVNGFGSIAAIARQKIDSAPSGPAIPTPATKPASPPRCVQIASRRRLERGDSGPSVKVLQNALLGRGFNVFPDRLGVFGEHTQAQVACFQKAAGLKVDGVVGPNTWRALGQ